MNTDTVNKIFNVFSGTDDISCYAEIISLAVSKVSAMAKDENALADSRLCCLAAALAAIYAADISDSQAKCAISPTGTSEATRSFPMRSEGALRLYNQMKAACSDLINPIDDFVFIHTDVKQEDST